ncbi:MAG: hypothetical protein H0V89_12820 [Deltaproteobacteria bacterium]|nr:hypothetical protein [Deltaproteobacteria bacterium]
MTAYPMAPQDAGTVPVRVQVIDLEPFALDMVVPTYLPTKDLTTRVARDAGLGAFWPDGARRTFYLRARGRLLGDEEKLQDLGIVPNELLHLLPEPPAGSAVEERAPEYPPSKGYTAAGHLNVASGLALVLAWTVGWSLALSVSPTAGMGLLPGIGLSLLATSFARHLWGGSGSRFRVPLTGGLVYFPLVLLAAIGPILGGANPRDLALALGPAGIGGFLGILLAWLAWAGAVEPLPKITAKQVQEAVAAMTWSCGICGGVVTQDNKADCTLACGRVFHAGCYKARQALSSEGCSVCGYGPSAAAVA